MSLHDYMKMLEKAALADFAVRCDTTVGQLKQIAYGNRRANGRLAVSIERETQGAVSCEQLRPDIDRAYLRGSKAA